MSADSKNVRDSFVDQLANFDEKLRATVDNVDMLADIRQGIGKLIASSGNSEAQIRKILQDGYDAGALRKETFQLVKSMLDRFVAGPKVASQHDGDDAFSATAVIQPKHAPDSMGDSNVQVGSILRDRYLLLEEIASGSLGVVYKAQDRQFAEDGGTQQSVAVKVLSPQLVRNGAALRTLQREAAKCRCLVHPHIVRSIDLDREDDLYFLTMEWLDGRMLANILDSSDASIIDQQAAFRIIRQVADGLDYAHRCGIVHADIQPANIMIMPNGDAKLFDFGMARVRQKQNESNVDLGVPEPVTAAYSSMQVLTGEEPTVADDVFSLACLLYRLVAGYRVFGPRDAAQASQEGMKPQRLRALTDNQWRAMKKALSNSRVMRFDSVRDFMDALGEKPDKKIVVEAAERLVEVDVEDEVDEKGGSGKWLLAFIVVAGLAGGAAYELGYLEPLLERIANSTTATPAAPAGGPIVEERREIPQAVIKQPVAQKIPDEELPAETEIEVQASAPNPLLVDFSKLPPAALVVPISMDGGAVQKMTLKLREGGTKAIVDFVRDGDLSTLLTLRLKEVDYSGDRSPWAAGQYAISNSGVILFPVGQARGRVTLTMASDQLREADQRSTLRLGELGSVDSEIAILIVILEDDDQRVFEARLPVNTVAFAAHQTSVHETDGVARIDVIRLNPDDSKLLVEFTISDVTATQGADYFAPDERSIVFGPGQRLARLLVPLVRDSQVEGDETFIVKLVGVPDVMARDVPQQIAVVIHDGGPQTP